MDEDTRAEVLYDTCLKNVIEPGDDEQGRDLHTTFDQVLCKNVVFEYVLSLEQFLKQH